MQPVRSSVQISAVRDYWDARPCNVRHGTAPVGSLEWSQQVTSRKYFVEPHILKFAQFERWRGKKVLEVGCGIGTDTLQFIRAGAKVYAVDVSEASLALTFDRFEAEGFWPKKIFGSERNITFLVSDAEAYLPAKNFDLAYSFGVLHHTPNPAAALRNIYSALKPGGELRIMLYASISLKFLLREQPEAQAGCPIARTYTGWSARKMLQAAGFEVKSVTKAHIFPWDVKEYVAHRYVKRWPFRWMPKWMFLGMEKSLGHHLLIVARKPGAVTWWPS